jgi:hypothetical protein
MATRKLSRFTRHEGEGANTTNLFAAKGLAGEAGDTKSSDPGRGYFSS